MISQKRVRSIQKWVRKYPFSKTKERAPPYSRSLHWTVDTVPTAKVPARAVIRKGQPHWQPEDPAPTGNYHAAILVTYL
jgi:hypothetical protein